MKVYVVEVGCYSDRYIARVCESEEAAKKFIQLGIKYKLNSEFEYGNYSIEEYETDDAAIDHETLYICARYCENNGALSILDDEVYDKPFETRKDEDWSKAGDIWIDVCLEACRYDRRKDRDKILKICRDRLAEWKAKRAGIT